ncbi:MAG TPA: glycosyltransferase family 4 protein [Candidatus Saccharimonadales bacterium]|nr:glycosyltransferase family 4 protein [Candidatus Saccharimonadales bacterium]
MMVRAYLASPVPNDIAYSPTGIAVAIAEGLAAKGHAITFFGPEGTSLNGVTVQTNNIRPLASTQQQLYELVAVTDLFQDYIPSLYDQYVVKDMFERAMMGEFDVLVFHHPESAMGFAKLYPTVPVLYVVHDYLDEKRRQVIEMHHSINQHFVSISNSQRRDAPDFPYAATVYNGIDTELFSFNADAEDYLMYAGRIVPEKGVKEAIQVALKTDRRLIITGQVTPVSQWYFDEHIKPHLSDKILYLGMIDKAQLAKYYQKAAALLVPIRWEEPFGLTMAEAMACGTPIIAFRRGSVPEVVKDGKTGFIVENTAEMIEAIENISKINRQDCRTHVEKNFTNTRMVNNYEKVLYSLAPDTTPKAKTFIKNVRRISKKVADQLL